MLVKIKRGINPAIAYNLTETRSPEKIKLKKAARGSRAINNQLKTCVKLEAKLRIP